MNKNSFVDLCITTGILKVGIAGHFPVFLVNELPTDDLKKKKNTFLTFIFDFNDKVVIPIYLLQYWKIFSLFLIFLKYERLGKYFPHCTQHREIATTYEQKFLC